MTLRGSGLVEGKECMHEKSERYVANRDRVSLNFLGLYKACIV